MFGRLGWYDLGSEAQRQDAREASRGHPGVYLLRRKGSSRIAYIGSSEPGAIQRRKAPAPLRLWKTINRHFQSCRSRGAYSFGSDNWCTTAGARDDYELALLLTRTGQAARQLEEEAIEHYKPEHNAAPPPPAAEDDGIPF